MSATLDSSEILAREDRDRRWAVPAAVLAGGLPLLGTIVQIISQARGAPLSQPGQLVYLNAHSGPFIGAAVLQGVGALATGLALIHLYRATRARRPRAPRALPPLALVGAVGTGVATVVVQALVLRQVGRFTSQGGQTFEESLDALRGSGAFSSSALIAASSVLRLASLLLAVAIVGAAVNAMRTGLLTRLLGYLGIFAGVLVGLSALQAGGAQFTIIESFWLLALAALFAGRWPGGLPLAWRTGQAEPWPTMQEQREAAAVARSGTPAGEPPAGPRSGPATVTAPATAPAVPPAASSSPSDGSARPGAARRKRKKRR